MRDVSPTNAQDRGLGGVAVGLLPAVVWVPGSIPGPAGAGMVGVREDPCGLPLARALRASLEARPTKHCAPGSTRCHAAPQLTQL